MFVRAAMFRSTQSEANTRTPESEANDAQQLELLHDFVQELGNTLEERLLWQHAQHYGQRLLGSTTVHFEEADFQAGAESYVLPVQNGTQCYATLIATRLGESFSKTEISLLENVARSLGSAIGNARAYASAVEEADRDPIASVAKQSAWK